MRYKRKSVTHEKLIVTLNMTPLIDCVLQLLIFFMLAGSFVLQTGVRVELPKARVPKLQDKQDIVITITRTNEIFLNEERLSSEQLPVMLLEKLAQSKDKMVLIKPDKRVETGKLVEVMSIAKSVGVESLGIATEPQ
ncbi:MAG: biopolymer transporter ExbD [Candidatus Abyssobacteria bacterium SURF_17]|jgi:biopolymer transport protein ExbD|uniref:Biopolymer transporter ExbD n=1 Tax=Candidatus Abyssobacteria bacterium SURF_17 TaxID=2093361 RepID=A0A419ER38_9BACT|nr:MAG: biopolymer transporter ExbD [Candidatus Abyssubacteria bacterium SURF_17]